ncbi:NDP-sugar synthase [Sulfurisphaera javensis]|uniref:NDP-sugar synthase n=1 Tax=Sulfurisphaera javensis TaxID=2049879 RepID=A0AAT9GPF7_9CREN
MQAVILAGGKGEGLLPYTEKYQKETISLLGNLIISYSINGLKKAGINDFVIVTSNKGKNKIEEELSKLSVSAEVIIQKREGINGAIKDGLEKVSDNNVVIAFGDIVAPEEFYVSLINTYLTTGADYVVPLVPVSEGVSTYGLARIEGDKIEITESDSTLALAGAYVIKNEPFDDFLEYLNSRKDKLKYFVWSEKWIDIGYPEDLINAVELLLDNKKSIISDSAEISKTAIIGKGVIIDDNAIIDDYTIIKGPAYIGKNVYIGNFSLIRDYSSIERGAKVGAYCEITHSLIQPEAEIGSKSYLTYTIVGEKAKIGANVITSSYPAKVVRGKVNKLGALISPETEIKHGEILKVGAKI